MPREGAAESEGLAGGKPSTDQREARVDDWSWRQTRRRIRVLVRLARPYKSRTALAIVTLVGYTLVALLPPYLAKVAVDDGIVPGDLDALTVVSPSSSRPASPPSRCRALRPTAGWVGERALADLRIQLFDHLQRLSLGYYERNRTGAIISRITNDVEALDQLVTDGISSLVQNSLLLLGTAVVLFILDWRLALATLVVLPFMAAVTAWFRSRSNRVQTRARAARARDGDARRGHLGDARGPVVHAGSRRARSPSAASTSAIARRTTRPWC